MRFYFMVIDLLLLVAAFVAVHLWNYGHLEVAGRHQDLFWILVGLWALTGLLFRKFKRLPELGRYRGLALLLRAGLALVLAASLTVMGFHLWEMSRMMVYGTILVFVALELAGFWVWRSGAARGRARGVERGAWGGAACGRAWSVERGAWSLGRGAWSVERGARSGEEGSLVPTLMAGDGFLLVVALAGATWLKRGTFQWGSSFTDVVVILFGLWLLCSLLTGKFDRHKLSNAYDGLGMIIRSAVLMVGGLAVVLYLFRLGAVSRVQVFGAVGIFFVLECGLYWTYSAYRRYRERGESPLERAPTGAPSGSVGKTEATGFSTTDAEATGRHVGQPVRERLTHALEFFDHEILAFIDEHLDLDAIDRGECSLLNTETLFNLQALEPDSHQLILNLHRLNDVRHLNEYFRISGLRLRRGGYLAGACQTFGNRRAWFEERFRRPVDKMLFALDFIWTRVFPKLSLTQVFYFAVTQGRNRVLSRAEVLGRICFSGFEIVAERNIGNKMYFIARNVAPQPEPRAEPVYGPLIRLKRHGIHGRPLTVFKFRTMHPYSEFLQAYVHRTNNLDAGGKFRNDFRVTAWGSFLRRTWLDELPMLYNWLRGDLQLIGVRPLSQQYLNLYDGELRELRSKVKPGLLPPFYADNPKTLQEIMESERRYLQHYLRKPMLTQFRYFFLCFRGIVIQGNRSA